MEMTMNTLNRLISCAFNDISRAEQNAIYAGGMTDVSVNEAHTVDAIGYYVPKTMSEVASKLEITMGTLTVAINHLVKKGYVLKERSPKDRRVFMLSLTDNGKKLYKVHQNFHFELVKNLIIDLSDYEADMFIEALSSLNKYLGDKLKMIKGEKQ
jgi:DNA-binding MarR family transcriptional regulator